MQNIDGIDGNTVSLGVENYDENLETQIKSNKKA